MVLEFRLLFPNRPHGYQQIRYLEFFESPLLCASSTVIKNDTVKHDVLHWRAVFVCNVEMNAHLKRHLSGIATFTFISTIYSRRKTTDRGQTVEHRV